MPNKVDLEEINNFPSVPPSEEPVFILTAGQLQDIITRAIQPLQDRIESLESTAHKDRADFERLRSIHKIFVTQTTDDLNHIFAVVEKKPQPHQMDRADILRALLAANGGKMLAKDARRKMHLSRSRFSELMSSMGEFIDTKPYHLNKSAKILILKSVPRNTEHLFVSA